MKVKLLSVIALTGVLLGVVALCVGCDSGQADTYWERCYDYKTVTISGTVHRVAWEEARTTIYYTTTSDHIYSASIPWHEKLDAGQTFTITYSNRYQVACVDGEPMKNWTVAYLISSQVTGFEITGETGKQTERHDKEDR